MAFYDEIHTTKKHRLGTRKLYLGNEYIYMKGVASLAAKDVVAYDELFVTTRTLAATIGQIAVAMAAVTSTTNYGWFQIWGIVTGVPVLTSFADNSAIYTTSTPGSVDDSGAGAEEFVFGMWGRSGIASGVATMQLSYPFKHAATLD